MPKSQSTPLICETWWWGCYSWACMAATGTGSLAFIDNVTTNCNSRINSEVHSSILSAQVQCNVIILFGQCLKAEQDNDRIHTPVCTFFIIMFETVCFGKPFVWPMSLTVFFISQPHNKLPGLSLPQMPITGSKGNQKPKLNTESHLVSALRSCELRIHVSNYFWSPKMGGNHVQRNAIPTQIT